MSGIAGTVTSSVAGMHADEYFYVPSLSHAMRSVEQALSNIAESAIPVLLVGEGGTGKHLLAWRLHQLARRAGGGFTRFSPAGLAATLFSQPNRGDGSGAHHPFDAATVFVEEIGDLDPSCQQRLVQLLPDNGNGSSNGRSWRLVSSTRRNLEDEVRSARFREDLYYRISGVCLAIPPLRQRKEDLPILAEFFLERYALQLGTRKPALSIEGLRILGDYAWPGNVRELEGAMKKLAVLGNEEAALWDLCHGSNGKPANGHAPETVSLKQAARAASRQAEREMILKVLSRTQWNRKRAARELQISYKALLYKLKQIRQDSTDL